MHQMSQPQSTAPAHAARPKASALNVLSDRQPNRIGRFTYSSKHARKRIWQRVGLSLVQVIQMIERGLAVHIGMAPASNREHLALYSPVDDKVFVAIRDKLTGIIITVWPLEYHRNLAWPVAERDCRAAKQRYESWAKALQESQERDAARKADAAKLAQAEKLLLAQTAPVLFTIKASYLLDGRYKTKTLCKERLAECADIYDFVRRSESIDRLEEIAREKGVDLENILSISIQQGNNGNAVLVPIQQDRQPVFVQSEPDVAPAPSLPLSGIAPEASTHEQ